MSKGAASNLAATPATSPGGTNRKTASGSTNRRMSQGQAMRSTLGRARVTQTERPRSSRLGILAAGTIGNSAAAQSARPPWSVSASTPALRSQAATPWLFRRPSSQTTTTDLPRNAGAHSATRSGARTSERARGAGQQGIPCRRARRRRPGSPGCRSGVRIYRRGWCWAQAWRVLASNADGTRYFSRSLVGGSHPDDAIHSARVSVVKT